MWRRDTASIYRPERSVLFDSDGVHVIVPQAASFAVHKVIVAVERRDMARTEESLTQAETLMQALAKNGGANRSRRGRQPRACRQLSHMITQTSRTPARNVLASLS